jgi:uncharacterized protein
MKYLLLIVIVLAVLWLARAGRSRGAARPPSGTPPQPQAMVACAHCGVHLPRGDAVAGAQDLYCSEAHRLARGDRA